MAAFVIWSNQKRMWWRPDGRGYTDSLDEAGRFDRERAEYIVELATCGGQLTYRRTDPVTGEEYSQLPEVLLLAPEDTPPVQPDGPSVQLPDRPSAKDLYA
jgi:hypothetical protein